MRNNQNSSVKKNFVKSKFIHPKIHWFCTVVHNIWIILKGSHCCYVNSFEEWHAGGQWNHLKRQVWVTTDFSVTNLEKLMVKIYQKLPKLQNFSDTQILREIKVGESRCLKFTIFTHLEALNFDFYEFLHLLEDWNLPN